jgi:hypothetical protein
MNLLIGSKIVAGCVAIACVSILSGCWRNRRDPVYVERVQVHVDDHRDHHDEHRGDDHRDDRR